MQLSPDIEDRIVELANGAQKGKSFYLYDTSIMQDKIKQLKKLMPEQVDIYYAAKANPHQNFLKAAMDAGAKGIEIASMGEGQKAVDAGFSYDQILFTGPGKSEEELVWSVENEIHKVHIESLTEAHRLNKICEERGKTQDILVRVNPNFDIHGAQTKFSGDSSKFGIDEDLFADALNDILALPHLNFKGLHVYAASGVLQVEDLLENCRRVFTLARDIEAQHEDLRCDIIDFGGGFGIDYMETGADFSVETYANELQKMIDGYGFADRKFILELGRYLTADSGWYITDILDIKNSLGKKQVICRGGSHHFRRPVALNINHPLVVIPQNQPKIFDKQMSVKDEFVYIGGPLCNGSADKLAPKGAQIKEAHIGDILVVGLAGAYGYSMSHLNFLSHPYPDEIFV
jgi:diaminopimelate decarboxylase